MAYFNGVFDIGGTMVKAAIYDMDGNEIAVHGEKLHISYPHSGQNERDMYEVKDMSLKAIKRCDCKKPAFKTEKKSYRSV